VLHHEGTCTRQRVNRESDRLFHALISRFRDLTNVPLVLNTSFNDQEPRVASPADALATFLRTPIDLLFLGDRLVRRS
jgi:carbamoyltransferase